ncbi:MAG: leucine-rich repeat domain-containing protein, partial [Synergistaceae bacterium]|nr:leucine-rich repeat domain-containing protein [Synergistaceae bacterium]
HILSLLVSHTAYLMHEDSGVANGLTWNELAEVWYNSISCGLSHGIIESYLSSREKLYANVQSCVVKAAQELINAGKLPQSKLSVIEQAFNTVGDTSSTTSANLSGKVTNKATGAALSGVKVTVYKAATSSTASATLRAAGNSRSLQGSLVSRLIQAVKTFLTEYFSVNLKQGTYSVTFSKEGYHPYTAEVSIGTEDVELDVSLSLSVDISLVSEDIPIDEEHFPDERFRDYLRRHDIDNDGILSRAEIANVTVMDFYGNATYSLQGIKYFVALQKIDCTNSWLTSLDLSGCTALNELYCRFNSLTYLDVSGCTALQILDCPGNNLTTLKLNGCTALSYLECTGNQLTSIDVSKNTALETLNCGWNQLTALDLSKNTALQYLQCDNNQLMVLDVSKNTALKTLDCSMNQLTALDVSKSTALQYLNCFNNQLTVLDVSKNTALEILYCYYNQLTTLTLSNKHTALEQLFCGNNQLTALNVSGCTALESLECYDNQLTSLNVDGCTALTSLSCSNNQLTDLDVSSCTALKGLYCSNNQLTTLDLSNCHNLYANQVDCDSNVTVIWPSSTPSTASTFSASSSGSRTASYAPGVLAVLPAFTPPVSGTYTFTVSLDSTPPEGSTLLLLADSEDLDGSFALAAPPDTVTVSADFTAGRTYIAVIVAESESGSLNGGCNAGTVGIILFAGLLFVSRKTKR